MIIFFYIGLILYFGALAIKSAKKYKDKKDKIVLMELIGCAIATIGWIFLTVATVLG